MQLPQGVGRRQVNGEAIRRHSTDRFTRHNLSNSVAFLGEGGPQGAGQLANLAEDEEDVAVR